MQVETKVFLPTSLATWTSNKYFFFNFTWTIVYPDHHSVRTTHSWLTQLMTRKPHVAADTLPTGLQNSITNIIGELFYRSNMCFCYVKIWWLNKNFRISLRYQLYYITYYLCNNFLFHFSKILFLHTRTLRLVFLLSLLFEEVFIQLTFKAYR